MTTDQHASRAEYVPGEWRDLPRTPGGYRPHAHTPKPKGIDWDALTPKCSTCGEPSGQLGDGARCPTCRGDKPVDVFAAPRRTTTSTAASTSAGVLRTYDQLADDEVARRYAPDDTRLGQELGRLAAADPAVAASSDRLDDTVRRIVRPDDHVRPDLLQVNTKTTASTTTTRGDGGRAATEAEGEAAQQPATIDALLRDTENHANAKIRASRERAVAALTRLGDLVAEYDAKPHHRAGSKLEPHADEIIRRYQAGESTNRIAETYDASGVGVGLLLRRHGITPRPRGTNHHTSRTTNPTGATA